MRAARKSLWGSLQRKRQLTFDHQYYFGNHVIDSLFAMEDIAAAVAEFIPDEGARFDIGSTIFRMGRQTFAILLWNHEEESITKFIEHRVLDGRLPLEKSLAERIVPDFGESFALEWQWHFLPFTLDSDLQLHHGIVEHERIFPYVYQESIGEGAFGEVLLTAVDSSQQTLTTSVATRAAEEGQFIPDLQVVQMKIGDDELPVVRIARKRFKLPQSQTEESRDRMIANERSCLRELGRLKHRNIIQMLGSYAYRDERSILFPHVEMNLEEFLKRSDRFGDFIHDRTFFSALQGLASALACVHNLKLNAETHGIELERIGYHHDFRPQNVLVSPKTFLLADFGLSKLKPVGDGSRTEWKTGGPSYRAPECTDMTFRSQEVGRSIDMWAFGCMVAEVVTYMKSGPDGITQFRRSRHSPGVHPRVEDESFYNGLGLKPAVHQWFDTLLGEPASLEPASPYAADLVALSLSMLVVDTDERLKCPRLCKKLNFLCARSHLMPAVEALERLINQMEASLESTEGQPIMELWFELERLKAWAAVFGLIGQQRLLSRFDHTEIEEGEVEKLRLVSHKMLGRLQLELNKYDSNLHHTDMMKSIAVDTSVLDEIRDLIQDLWELLSQRNKNRAQFLWCAEALDTHKIERLHILELQKPTARDDQYSSISALAAIKSLLLQFERDLPSEGTWALLAEGDVGIEEHFGPNRIGTYQGSEKVFIEVLHYDKRWEGMGVEERATRMQLVAEGFHQSQELPELRVPKCIGFIPMKNAFGFLYPFPTATDVPNTLLALLYAKPKLVPALETRIQLANKLVSCIAGLHSIGWLHRNLNSDNIVFFTKQGCSTEEAIENPYVIGLTRARPDSDGWHSEGPNDARIVDYSHPEYAKTRRFQVAYDYYSLGIILLEIGLWRSVGSITSKWPTAAPEAIKFTLMEKYVKDLRSQMGSAYYGAVLACMDGCLLSGEGRENATTSRLNFYERVGDVLDRMSRSAL
ncbi:kinase-like protein [Mytilinidion resinicola]|uniref:Kinase-like protein n=1 Tax=Mytilinidion resinicola TaxID=574789 RepID=A0A6A6YK16_9PEZI|nr:kinase-like protein [Mytilinidion resinicola]KAF2808304.1 kinase-like protein [Mytilinidion resinicola]